MISPETDFMDLFRGIVFDVIGLKNNKYISCKQNGK